MLSLGSFPKSSNILEKFLEKVCDFVAIQLVKINYFQIYSLIFVTWTTSETQLKFSLYDFNDYDDELAHLQIPTHD